DGGTITTTREPVARPTIAASTPGSTVSSDRGASPQVSSNTSPVVQLIAWNCTRNSSPGATTGPAPSRTGANTSEPGGSSAGRVTVGRPAGSNSSSIAGKSAGSSTGSPPACNGTTASTSTTSTRSSS